MSRRAMWLAALVLATAACASRGWVSDHPDVADRARREPASFVEPAVASWNGARGLAGLYTMRVARGVGRRTVSLSIAVRVPGDLDFVVLAPTGATQAYLRVGADEVGLALVEERVVYRGPATEDAFEHALGFDLSAADAVAVLMGYGLAESVRRASTAHWDEAARRIRLDGPGGRRAWLHPVTQRFDRVERTTPRGQVVATLGDWSSTGPPVPAQVSLRIEPDGYGIELRLEGEPMLDPEFDPGFFEIQVPPGFEERRLSELAAEGGLFRRSLPDHGNR